MLTIDPGTNTSFGRLKQINAGVLNIGYVESGPAGAHAVLLLHGWPYDIHSYADVAPLLASAGYRVIDPYLRGYGTTRFLSSETARNGQQSVVAADIIAMMDALKIEKATIGGLDWGARTANIIAVLWPERYKAMVSVSGYLIGSPKARPRCRRKRSSHGGTNIILRRNAAEQGTIHTGMTSITSFGISLRPNGNSMMPPTAAPQPPSITQTMSVS